MRVLIIEDETYNFESLKRKLLRLYPLADIEGPITNLVDLEQMFHYEQHFDVIYCDIRLEDGLCFTPTKSRYRLFLPQHTANLP